MVAPIGSKFGAHMRIRQGMDMLNKLPLETPWGMGGVGIKKFNSLGKLPNCWDQIWHTSADSCGNGHAEKNLVPRDPRGHVGVLRGHKFKSWGKLPNG